MEMMPAILFAAALLGVILLLFAAFSGPSADKIQTRRLEALKGRHISDGGAIVEAQMRRILATRETKLDSYFTRLIPNPALMRKRIEMTG